MKVIEVNYDDYDKLELKPIFEELEVDYVLSGYYGLLKLTKEEFFSELRMFHVPSFDNPALFFLRIDAAGTNQSYSLVLYSGKDIVGHIRLKYG